MTKGGRNLMILGFAAVAISVAATGASLLIYHNSGDIYLDRSRPGFLPDEEEIEEEETKRENSYEFSNEGEINKAVMKEYLEKLDQEIQGIKAVEKPYSDDALYDSVFGL